MKSEVVLIACPDEKGLIHKVAGILLWEGLNITETQEYVNRDSKKFFMRVQYEGNSNCADLETKLKAILPQPAFCKVRKFDRRKVVLFVSKEPHCLGDLLLRHFSGELMIDVLAVISQHEDCRKLTEQFEIPFHCVPVSGRSREAHEVEIFNTVEKYNPDYLILARYMRIFTGDFVQRFPQRMINIHHSFLPSFIGKDPYVQAHARGVKIVGATSHFVIEGLDEGPIITQSVIRVSHADSASEMARRGQDVEKIVLARAIELVVEDRILLDERRTIVFER